MGYKQYENKATLRYRFVAEDQWGNTVWIERYPRKELLEWVGKGDVKKMYIGNDQHIGYIVGKHWFVVMRLEPL